MNLTIKFKDDPPLGSLVEGPAVFWQVEADCYFANGCPGGRRQVEGYARPHSHLGDVLEMIRAATATANQSVVPEPPPFEPVTYAGPLPDDPIVLPLVPCPICGNRDPRISTNYHQHFPCYTARIDCNGLPGHEHRRFIACATAENPDRPLEAIALAIQEWNRGLAPGTPPGVE